VCVTVWLQCGCRVLQCFAVLQSVLQLVLQRAYLLAKVGTKRNVWSSWVPLPAPTPASAAATSTATANANTTTTYVTHSYVTLLIHE